MALIKIDKLVPGTVLSEDARDINYRLLLAKGQAIEDRHIRMLKMWGVFEVHVADAEPVPDALQPIVDDERLDAVSREMWRIFSTVDGNHPVIKEVVRLSVQYRLKQTQRVRTATIPGVDVTDRPAAVKGLLERLDRLDVRLPEAPSLVYELNEIIADPFSSAGDIARVVNKSPSLAALLLKIVNSAFYGFRSKIDSIPRAVMLIGSREVSHLALGITIMETFKSIPRRVIDVASFLEHSLACGIVARIIAAHGNIAHTEQIFVSGMLHDIGRLVLFKYYPEAAKQSIADALRIGRPLFTAEPNILGCTHAQIGKKLINKWKLPYSLANNVAYHHQPSAAPSPEPAAAIQMADMIVHGLGIGASGETTIPSFDVNAWECVNLPANAFSSMVNQAVHQLETFREALHKG